MQSNGFHSDAGGDLWALTLARAQVAAEHTLPQDLAPIVGHAPRDGRFGHHQRLAVVDLEAGAASNRMQLAPPVALGPDRHDVLGHRGREAYRSPG
jgi:hypothetical protein